ncbi:DNA-binding response regulator, partial [Pseudobacillus badius]
MMNSIRILRESLSDAGERVARQYGPDSNMPKAKDRTSAPVYQEYLRREKRWKKVHEYERKIQLLQQRLQAIEDEREIEVLHWLLEGKSYRWIAMHMGLSHSHIRRLRWIVNTK